MNKALLDTDTLSELGRAVNPTVTRNGATYLAQFGRYTVSVVTVMEIVRGLVKKQATQQLQVFAAAIPSQEVLVFEHAAAELAGRIEGELERQGRPIGRADKGLIECGRDGRIAELEFREQGGERRRRHFTRFAVDADLHRLAPEGGRRRG